MVNTMLLRGMLLSLLAATVYGSPSTVPSASPTDTPTLTPSSPSTSPTFRPTVSPSMFPTESPEMEPTANKNTSMPSITPTRGPTDFVGCGANPDSCHECMGEQDCSGSHCFWNMNDNQCQGDVCRESYCSYWDQSHCMFSNDPHCNQVQVPCRDCVGPGQSCHGIIQCTDPLSMCKQFPVKALLENGVPADHPCVSDECRVTGDFAACSSQVYGLCCNPSIMDDCRPDNATMALRETVPCSPQGCSAFLEDRGTLTARVPFNESSFVCPFNDTSICEHYCPDQKQNLYESFGSVETDSCSNATCISHILSTYNPTIHPPARDMGMRRLRQVLMELGDLTRVASHQKFFLHRRLEDDTTTHSSNNETNNNNNYNETNHNNTDHNSSGGGIDDKEGAMAMFLMILSEMGERNITAFPADGFDWEQFYLDVRPGTLAGHLVKLFRLFGAKSLSELHGPGYDTDNPPFNFTQEMKQTELEIASLGYFVNNACQGSYSMCEESPQVCNDFLLEGGTEIPPYMGYVFQCLEKAGQPFVEHIMDISNDGGNPNNGTAPVPWEDLTEEAIAQIGEALKSHLQNTCPAVGQACIDDVVCLSEFYPALTNMAPVASVFDLSYQAYQVVTCLWSIMSQSEEDPTECSMGVDAYFQQVLKVTNSENVTYAQCLEDSGNATRLGYGEAAEWLSGVAGDGTAAEFNYTSLHPTLRRCSDMAHCMKGITDKYEALFSGENSEMVKCMKAIRTGHVQYNPTYDIPKTLFTAAVLDTQVTGFCMGEEEPMIGNDPNNPDNGGCNCQDEDCDCGGECDCNDPKCNCGGGCDCNDPKCNCEPDEPEPPTPAESAVLFEEITSKLEAQYACGTQLTNCENEPECVSRIAFLYKRPQFQFPQLGPKSEKVWALGLCMLKNLGSSLNNFPTECPIGGAQFLSQILSTKPIEAITKNKQTLGECLNQQAQHPDFEAAMTSSTTTLFGFGFDITTNDVCFPVLACWPLFDTVGTELGFESLVKHGCINNAIVHVTQNEAEAVGVSASEFRMFRAMISVGQSCLMERHSEQVTDHPLQQCMQNTTYPAGRWNYNAQCIAETEDTRPHCDAGCCEVASQLASGTEYYGAKNSTTFQCGQISGNWRDRKCEVIQCLRQQCGACFDGNNDGFADGVGGMFGPMQKSSNATLAQGFRCAAKVYEHCTEQPDDPGCVKATKCPFKCDPESDRLCPCEEDGCVAYYSAPLDQRNECREFQQELTRGLSRQGFLQPEAKWHKDELERGAGLMDMPAEGAIFEMTSALSMLQASCPLANQLIQCFPKAFEHCNGRKAFESNACKSLSTCGDGVVTYGEQCDDGNNSPFRDGCRNCQLGNNVVCRTAGEPCEYCERRDVKFENGQLVGCPFCRNQRLPGRKSPCSSQNYSKINMTRDGAEAFDNEVKAYCDEALENGINDPGCEIYQSRLALYEVPFVKNNCTVTIREVSVEHNQIKGAKLALIECPFVAIRDGQQVDVTPKVPYWAPKNKFTEDELAALEAHMQVKLDERARYEMGELVPISMLTNHELYSYDDDTLANNGQPLLQQYDYRFDKVMRVQYTGSFPGEENSQGQTTGQGDGTTEGQQGQGEQQKNCEYPTGETIQLTPACDDPLAATTKNLLKYLKFQDNDEDFKMLNLRTDFELECASKPHVLQGYIILSSTRTEYRNGAETVVEEPEYFCPQDGSNIEWNQRAEKCTTKESAIKSRQAQINFGQMLFDDTCTDRTCPRTVSKCATAGLTKGHPKTSLATFDNKAQKLVEAIAELDDVQSWADVKLVLNKVNTFVASGPFSNALDLYRSFANEGSQERMLTGVENYCPHDSHTFNETTWTHEVNKDWLEDACCNHALREFMCCAPQDVPGGKVRVLTGFIENKLQICDHPSQIKSVLRDLRSQLEAAQTRSEEIDELVDREVFDNLWEFEHTCRSLIDNEANGESDECTSDTDCYCQYSTCQSMGSSSRCVTSDDDMYMCFADCFANEYGTENELVFNYVKEEWGLGLNATNEDFVQAWGDRMTEEGCAGPLSDQPDIGKNGGLTQVCNDTCVEDNLCEARHLSDYLWSKYQPTVPALSNNPWFDSNNPEHCELLNGTMVIKSWGQVCMPPVPEGLRIPCEEDDQCRETCNTPCTEPNACEANNGTWFKREEHNEESGECCPVGLYVRESQHSSGKACSTVSPPFESGMELTNAECCTGAGGNWNEAATQSCCFGEFVPDCDSFGNCKNQLRCEEGTINTQASCHECEREMCQPLRQECRTCRTKVNECCEDVRLPENKDNCLKYEGCNDQTKYTETECTGAEPFCADWGWIRSEPAWCEMQTPDDAACESNGGSIAWNYGWSYCSKAINATDPDPKTNGCLADRCPDQTWSNYYSIEEPEFGTWTEQRCNAGCYIGQMSSNASITTSEWGQRCEVELPRPWDPSETEIFQLDYSPGATPEEGQCIVPKWMVPNKAKCDELLSNYNPMWIKTDTIFHPAIFSTQDQCEAGSCQGDVNSGRNKDPVTGERYRRQPWSTEQCKRLSGAMCSQHCTTCESDAAERNGGGVCFNMDTQVYTPLEGITETDCENATVVITSEDGVVADNRTWWGCPTFTTKKQSTLKGTQANNFCLNGEIQGGDGDTPLPSEIASHLQCRARSDRCPTEETCSAIGECSDRHEMTTYVCLEGGWTHGNMWNGEKIVTTVDSSTGAERTSLEREECTNRREIAGVCVEARMDNRCEDHFWHMLGCRSSNISDKTECKAQGHSWYEPSYDEASCLATKGCFNDFRMTKLNETECESCGGEVRSFFNWRGGKWQDPSSRAMTWNPDGHVWGPINQWIKVQASYKLKDELQVPILRAFAQNKKTQLFLLFNLITEILRKVACDCGSDRPDDTSTCFQETTKNGVTTAQVTPFVSCDDADQVANGAIVMGPGLSVSVKPNCGGNSRRRLESENESDSIEFTHSTAGGYDKYSPCSTEAEQSLLDALVVHSTTTLNPIIGQLIGDGTGVTLPSSVGSASFCVETRTVDIRQWTDRFDTFGVAVYDSTLEMFVSATTGVTVTSSSSAKVCMTVTESGVYYPMLGVASDKYADVSTGCAALNSCGSGSCVADKMETGYASCMCKCGFSGATCDVGCPNSCSGNGMCGESANTCTCTSETTSSGERPQYTGDDCSVLNCPADDQNVRCGGQGNCVLSTDNLATCECFGDYEGEACTETVATDGPEVTVVAESEDPDSSEQEEADNNWLAVTNEPSVKPSEQPSHQPSIQPSANPSVSPSTSPSKSPSTNRPSKTPYVANSPSEKPSKVPTQRPTQAPTIEPEPLATIDIPVDAPPPMADLGSFVTNMGSGIKSSLGTENAADDNIEVQVVVTIKENGAFPLPSAPSVEQKGVIKSTIKKVRCGVVDCLVSFASDSTGRRRLVAYSLDFEVEILVDKETDTTALADAVEFSSPSFAQAFQNELTDASSAAGTTVEFEEGFELSSMKEAVSVKFTAVAEVMVKDEMASPSLDVADLQAKVADTTTVMASVAESTGIAPESFGEVVVDLCKGRTCSGRGTCAVGVCTCTTTWMGSNCQIAMPSPTKGPTETAVVSATSAPTDLLLSASSRPEPMALMVAGFLAAIWGLN